MKKKALALLFAASLLAGTLAGCGKSDGSAAPAQPAAEEGAKEEAGAVVADNSEAYNIEMQIVTWGGNPDEIDQVEAAINAIIEPEINATVTLIPIAAWDLANETSRALAAGEKLDLACVFTFGQAMDSISNYTSKNMFRPLNDLYAAYGSDIDAALGERINLGYIEDTLYAVPCVFNYGNGTSFTARKDYLDQMGIAPEEGKRYTMEDLTPIFEAYKQEFGAGHYALSLYGTATDGFHQFYEIDALGGQESNGILMNAGLDGQNTVVDLFETDEYMEYCKQMREWYQAGYINPDVTTVSDDVTSQMKSGNYLGTIGSSTPGGSIGLANNLGVELVEFPLVEAYASTTYASEALWAIPNTCENPERVMQFLNILYQDRDLENDVDSLLSDGLAGVSYEVVEQLDGSKAIVKAGTGTWSQWVPNDLYGNSLTVPKFQPNEASIYDEIEAFNQKIVDDGRITKAFGYVFNPENVSTQAAAVASVATQYRSIVGYGTVDPEEVMPEFIQALKDAGIDDIIAENQKQLDAWYAAH